MASDRMISDDNADTANHIYTSAPAMLSPKAGAVRTREVADSIRYPPNVARG
jgi:hypothetical protein